MKTAFASSIVVQTIEDVFKVSFFEVKPPIFLGSSGNQPSEIRADCVACIIITPNKLREFVDVLQKEYEKYAFKIQGMQMLSGPNISNIKNN
jgi:hypothetical protein